MGLNLSALKKNQEKSGEESTKPDSGTDAAKNTASTSTRTSDDKDSSEQLPPSPQPGETESQSSPQKLKFGIKKPGGTGTPKSDSGNSSGVTTSIAKRFGSKRPNTGNANPPAAPDRPVSNPDAGSSPDSGGNDKAIGGLADLADSETGSPALKNRKLSAGKFSDEIPADAPERDLEGLDEQQKGFVNLLNGVYAVVHEPGFLGDVVSNIMQELQKRPEYRKLIQPKDIRTLIQGMRSSMGMAKIKKQEKKRNTGSKGKASKAVDSDMLGALDDAINALGTDLGD